MVGKVAVMGLLERHGKDGAAVCAWRLSRTAERTSCDADRREHVEPASTMNTDALPSYDRMG